MSEDLEGLGPLSQGAGRWLEALEWHTTLWETDQAALTSGTLRAWQQWYGQPDNRRAFDRLSALLAENTLYHRPAPPAARELESDRYDPSLSIREWRQARRTEAVAGAPRTAKRSRWVGPLRAMALAAGVLAALFLLRPWWLAMIDGGSHPTVYQTQVGELTEVSLEDGSTVTLGGKTRLLVEYTRRRRSIQLFYGEAWFRDKDIPHWPFVVTAGGGVITAVGTAFVVNRGSDGVVVMVTAGTVEVAARARAQRVHVLGQVFMPWLHLAAVQLQHDQQLSYSDDGTVGSVTSTDPRAVTAWTQGRLSFDDVPLREVIETVNRYWSRHIRVSGQAGELHFSGLVYEDQIEDWLDGLPRIFPVAIDAAGAHVCVRLRDSPSSAGPAPCAGPGT
ncbi:MAG: FecR domain-containing protein [Steroidobacteraceae bacterium]